MHETWVLNGLNSIGYKQKRKMKQKASKITSIIFHCSLFKLTLWATSSSPQTVKSWKELSGMLRYACTPLMFMHIHSLITRLKCHNHCSLFLSLPLLITATIPYVILLPEFGIALDLESRMLKGHSRLFSPSFLPFTIFRSSLNPSGF